MFLRVATCRTVHSRAIQGKVIIVTHQLHVPLVDEREVLLRHLQHLLGLRVDEVCGDVPHPAQARPVRDVHVLRALIEACLSGLIVVYR